MTEQRLRERLQQRAEEVHAEPIDYQRLWDDAHNNRRRRAMLFASVCTAAVVVAAASAALVVTRPSASPVLPPTGQTDNGQNQLPGAVPTEDQLIGSWRAVTILGQPASSWGMTTEQLGLDIGRDSGDLLWSGVEVCNGAGGHVRVSADGAFTTWGNGQTLIGCPATAGQPTVPQVVMKASLVGIDGGTLTLYDQDGSPLATFQAADDHPYPACCITVGPNEFPDASDIQGTWRVQIGGSNRYTGLDLSMTFDGNTLTFDGGCNDYAGTFTLVHQDFAATTTRLTAYPCPSGGDPVDDLLNQAEHATIAHGHLYLHADNFQILLSLTPAGASTAK